MSQFLGDRPVPFKLGDWVKFNAPDRSPLFGHKRLAGDVVEVMSFLEYRVRVPGAAGGYDRDYLVRLHSDRLEAATRDCW